MKSPLGRVYELDGWILLLGVGHDNNTSLHLAEHPADFMQKKTVLNGMPVSENGRTVWKEFPDTDISSDDFCDIGTAWEQEHPVRRCSVGSAECMLLRQRPLIDFAVEWLKQNRN